jgi:hypothetical protein
MERDLPDKLVQNGNRWDEAEAEALAFKQEFMARELITTDQNPRRLRAMRAVVAFWHRLSKGPFDPYRPERHYMRDPRPKWRAKHSFGIGANSH